MSENINTEASQKFPMMPVAPLGIIAMRGCEEMGKAVNDYLTRWQVDNSTDEKLHSFYGSEANGFLIRANCPRFGTGEGKGMLLDSVRGYDLYIICDVGAYQCTYKLYGRDVPMTPDEHYADLKRIIAAVSGKAKRINVIMPMLYEGRQHRRTARESMDCALMLQELVAMGVGYKGGTGDDTIIDLGEDTVRMLVILDKLGKFDEVIKADGADAKQVIREIADILVKSAE